jgi:hypothetical protein
MFRLNFSVFDFGLQSGLVERHRLSTVETTSEKKKTKF